MNDDALPLPDASCDVLVIGAGPAGSACAQALARGGLHVMLVDQHRFPRDKICGDGLIPDAHRALQRMGVHEAVMRLAQPATHVGCIAPRGGRIDVPGHLAVLPRAQLDALLLQAARAAGARFAAPWRLQGPLLEGDRIVGAQLQNGSQLQQVRARWTVLATGAAAKPLQAMGVCTRQSPTGIALRGYVRNDALRDRVHSLDVVWHKKLSGGYGWIFPCRDGVFNIGVGLADSHASDASGHGTMKNVNLRELFATFCAVHPAAAALMADGTLLGELKGAPLRCSLEGALPSRPGLLVVGEAVGSTYAFTGEGIGKALETGLLAADSVMNNPDEAAVRAQYAAGLQALKPRFDLYTRAQKINKHPWLVDLLIWRARQDGRLLRRMAGVLEETSNPGNLVSLRGIVRLFRPQG